MDCLCSIRPESRHCELCTEWWAEQRRLYSERITTKNKNPKMIRIKLKTGEILESEGLITDANEKRELGYLVPYEIEGAPHKCWICPKEEVVEEIK